MGQSARGKGAAQHRSRRDAASGPAGAVTSAPVGNRLGGRRDGDPVDGDPTNVGLRGNVSNKSTDPDGDGNLKVSDLLPTDPTVTLTCEITIDP